MKVLIKKTAGAEYSRDDYNMTLKSIRGQWVEVDTQYLFRNQYKLLTFPIRVHDKDIDAVQDDERKGLVKCGYCDAQFHSVEDLQAHYEAEENSAHKCENCRNYVNSVTDIIHEKSEYIDEQKNRVEVRTTKYVYGKKCRWNDGCNKFQHRNHKPEFFTPENTYFLRYPNGYASYFKSLSAPEKWAELGFEWLDNSKAAVFTKLDTGTYDIQLCETATGQWELSAFNSRTHYSMGANLLKYCLSNYSAVSYCVRFDPENGKLSEHAKTWDTMPKTAQKAIANAVEYLRDTLRKDYAREFFNEKGVTKDE